MAATPVPIALASAVPLTSAGVNDALTAFFGIGPVLGVLALVIALALVRPIVNAFRAVGGRR
jgi:hypothetical protein